MLLDEILQNRNQVIGAGGHSAVCQSHLTGGFAVLSDDNAACESVPVHVGIVAYIILGHDKGLFARRQENGAPCKGDVPLTVRSRGSDVLKPYQDVIPGIERFQDF